MPHNDPNWSGGQRRLHKCASRAVPAGGAAGAQAGGEGGEQPHCRLRKHVVQDHQYCEEWMSVKIERWWKCCRFAQRSRGSKRDKSQRRWDLVFQTGESHINLWPWLISQYDIRFAQNKSARSALMCPARRRSRYLKGHYLVLVIIIVIAIIMMIIIVVAIVMTIMIIVANKQEIIIVVPICNLQWSGVQRDSSPSCPRGV